MEVARGPREADAHEGSALEIEEPAGEPEVSHAESETVAERAGILGDEDEQTGGMGGETRDTGAEEVRSGGEPIAV